MDPLLKVTNLKTYFYQDNVETPAIDGVTFQIHKGETLGLVGESGSGKSVTSLSILQLVPKPHGKIIDGTVEFKGNNLLDYGEAAIRKVRGNEISMIFQEPMTSLNPVFTIGSQIEEVLILHQKLKKQEARAQAVLLLHKVGIPNAERRIHDYPHQLSGGMRQRVMIAIALACSPDLLIADEPTTALDVTTQAQILDLMNDLREETGTSILLITHDLGVVSEVCDRVAVMYLGRIVEEAEVNDFFASPKHPYSQGLLKSIPSLSQTEERLSPIRGQVPHPTDLLEGCRFCTRCDSARDLCFKEEPPLMDVDNQQVRCWKYSTRWEQEGEADDEGDHVGSEGLEKVFSN